MATDPVRRRGRAPLVLSMPHVGTVLPAALEADYVSLWRARRDTDWWIDELYAFAADLDATLIVAELSRSVIDLNRDPSGASLYPGQATTELCPTTTFDGEPLYRPGRAPDAAEIERRRAAIHAPYQAAIAAELARLKAATGKVVLYDCHSIRSEIPRLFDGLLPVFNLGTNGGASCDPALEATVAARLAASGEPFVVNGRFKGGYITRHHGRPAEGCHALQMEIACRGYMAEEPGPVSPADWPAPFDPARADHLIRTLKPVLQDCLAFAATAR